MSYISYVIAMLYVFYNLAMQFGAWRFLLEGRYNKVVLKNLYRLCGRDEKDWRAYVRVVSDTCIKRCTKQKSI